MNRGTQKNMVKEVYISLLTLFQVGNDTFYQHDMIKFSFSEKATKTWKNLPFVLTLLSKTSCFVKKGGRSFFQILWPSHNVLTLTTAIFFSAWDNLRDPRYNRTNWSKLGQCRPPYCAQSFAIWCKHNFHLIH